MKRLLCAILIASLTASAGGTGFSPAIAKAAEDKAPYTSKVEKEVKKKKPQYKEGQAIVLFRPNTGNTKAKAASAMGTKDISIKDIWNFDTVSNEKAAATSPQKATTKSSTSMVQDSTTTIGLVTSKTLSTEKLIRQLKTNRNILEAEPNYRCQTTALTNDTYADKQWAIENTGQNGGTPGTAVNPKTSWDKGIKGDDQQVVAVIDTGVDYTHEDLAQNIWENPYQAKLFGQHGYDFANRDADPLDDNGHGSHCAGIIGAKGDNGKGITGINQNTKIMALKFLDKDGSGWIADALAAYGYINRALSLGVKITAINNSWGPITGGDENEDPEGLILDEAMKMVGQKGAISICAAGNEAMDVDAYCKANPYKIMVAASNEKNQLAGFSNYGAESVDMAAPGANILSTVSYNCFNPSLTGASLCSNGGVNFADYEKPNLAGVTWGNPVIDATDAAKCQTDLDAQTYFGSNGKSLKLTLQGDAGDFVSVKVPYTLQATNTVPTASVMVQASGPDAERVIELWGEEYKIPSYFNLVDVPASKDVKDSGTLEALPYDAIGIDGEQNYWSSLSVQSQKSQSVQQRALVFVIECNYDGQYVINLDDMGVSKESTPESAFGKYDFYNGTSMATPQVVGAAALLKAEQPTLNALELADALKASVNKTGFPAGKVVTEGALDLSKQVPPAPQLTTATVDPKTKTIKLLGRGFTKGTGLTVKVNNIGATIVSQKAGEVVIKDQGWINNKVDIAVTNSNGTGTKQDVYLVAGKANYQKIAALDSQPDVVTTDGNRLFAASADSYGEGSGYLSQYNAEEQAFLPVADVDVEKIFKGDINKATEQYFRFGDDLIYLNGKVYNIGALCEGRMDEEDYFTNNQFKTVATAYSQEPRLIVMNPQALTEADISKSLGKLPADMSNTLHYTMASYNGLLYIMGGYDYTAKALSTKVKIYNPVTGKWANGPSLPQGRAGGKALQVGNQLIYTLGYAAGTSCPKNLIFNGKTWRSSTKTIAPYKSKSETISGTTYTQYQASVGLCKDGLVYSGMPTAGFGDTFTYNVKTDAFYGNQYNYITDINKDSMIGTAVGSAFYGIDRFGDLYKIPVQSGLVKIKATKKKGGTIKGANVNILPGSLLTLTAAAQKGYKLKSFTVNGQKIKGKKTTIRVTADGSASAKFKKKPKKVKKKKSKKSKKKK